MVAPLFDSRKQVYVCAAELEKQPILLPSVPTRQCLVIIMPVVMFMEVPFGNSRDLALLLLVKACLSRDFADKSGMHSSCVEFIITRNFPLSDQPVGYAATWDVPMTSNRNQRRFAYSREFV